MHIIVCIKQIIDPEIPADQFKLDPATKRQVRGGLSLVISAYDQNALEVALQLREKAGGKVTALCLGEAGAMSAVKSALGMGVDDGVLVSDPSLLDSDSFGVAHVLAWRIHVADGKAVARRIVEDGYERVESPLPLVVSIVSDDTNVPRYSKLKDIMAAAKKQERRSEEHTSGLQSQSNLVC